MNVSTGLSITSRIHYLEHQIQSASLLKSLILLNNDIVYFKAAFLISIPQITSVATVSVVHWQNRALISAPEFEKKGDHNLGIIEYQRVLTAQPVLRLNSLPIKNIILGRRDVNIISIGLKNTHEISSRGCPLCIQH